MGFENVPDDSQPQTHPADAFREAASKLAELKEYAAHFVVAKLDGIKVSLRNLALYAVLGIVGLIVGGGLLVTAAALLLTGLAGAIGALFEPDRPWVGGIVVGLLVIGGAVTGVYLMLGRLTRASRERTMSKYDQRKRRQREHFGRDAHDIGGSGTTHTNGGGGAR